MPEESKTQAGKWVQLLDLEHTAESKKLAFLKSKAQL